MGERRGVYRVLAGRKDLEALGVDGMIILKLIFKQWDVRHGLD
jgi:hypothetical protein